MKQRTTSAPCTPQELQIIQDNLSLPSKDILKLVWEIAPDRKYGWVHNLRKRLEQDETYLPRTNILSWGKGEEALDERWNAFHGFTDDENDHNDHNELDIVNDVNVEPVTVTRRKKSMVIQDLSKNGSGINAQITFVGYTFEQIISLINNVNNGE